MPTTLYDLPEIEYLDGRAHPKVSPRLTHGRVQLAVAGAIMRAAGSRGVVATEVGFNPGALDGSKTEFIPDVAYVSIERLDALSEADREKPPARYLATGGVLVLDVDPAQRRIYAHSASGVSTFSAGETFTHPAVPWLQFDVATAVNVPRL